MTHINVAAETERAPAEQVQHLASTARRVTIHPQIGDCTLVEEPAEYGYQPHRAPVLPIHHAAGAAQTRPAVQPRVPHGRLGKGELRALIERYLDENPTLIVTPHQLGKLLHRSPGAVANALEKLTALGAAVRISTNPRTYQSGPE